MTVPPARARLRRPAALAAAAALGCALAVIGAAPASGAGVGYVRLAHLSPDTPAVDVYLSSVSGAIPQRVFKAVPYGVVSKYLGLPPGAYSVSMRQQGAAPTSPPVLTTQATVAEGKAYTVAGVGRFADLGLRVIADDLGLPPQGKAKVRVVQASVRAPSLDIVVAGGETIATGVQFASTTEYRQVGPGRWTLRLTPAGGTAAATTVSAPLSDGAVYSLIVLDAKHGGLTAELRTDARGGGAPEGGVDTGGGGAVRQDSAFAGPAVTIGTLLIVVLLAGTLGLAALRLRRSRAVRLARH